MTPPRRKTVTYVAGLIASAAVGLSGHWVIPAVAVPGNAAQAAPESSLEGRLRVIEAKQEAILSELRDIRETLGFVRGRLSIENTK